MPFLIYMLKIAAAKHDYLQQFFHYRFVEPNRPRENAATNAQKSSVRTVLSKKRCTPVNMSIIERSFSKIF